MRFCPKCGGIAEYDSYHHAYVCNRSDCDYWEPKKPTNYKRLISKSPEELAEFLGEITNDGEYGLCPTTYCKCTERGCAGCWLDWLIEETEE